MTEKSLNEWMSISDEIIELNRAARSFTINVIQHRYGVSHKFTQQFGRLKASLENMKFDLEDAMYKDGHKYNNIFYGRDNNDYQVISNHIIELQPIEHPVEQIKPLPKTLSEEHLAYLNLLLEKIDAFYNNYYMYFRVNTTKKYLTNKLTHV